MTVNALISNTGMLPGYFDGSNDKNKHLLEQALRINEKLERAENRSTKSTMTDPTTFVGSDLLRVKPQGLSGEMAGFC